MIKLNITDNIFTHEQTSVAGRKADKIEWVKDGSGDPHYQFYTNADCYGQIKINVKSIAWLLESKAIFPSVYENFSKIANKFDLILTHSSEILNKYPHAKWIPGGGSYIGTSHGGGEEKIYDKTKFCSIVCSNKQMCQMHKFRYEVAMFLHNFYKNVDVYGTILGENEWCPIIDSLADYKYSVIIENYIDDAFFTEKIINTFLTGCVPIYCGARKIGDYFNVGGLVTFSSLQELKCVISELHYRKDDYESRLDAIKENFETAKKYRSIEEYINDNLSVWLK